MQLPLRLVYSQMGSCLAMTTERDRGLDLKSEWDFRQTLVHPYFFFNARELNNLMFLLKVNCL